MPLSNDAKVNETAGKLVETLKGAFGTPPGYRPGKQQACQTHCQRS